MACVDTYRPLTAADVPRYLVGVPGLPGISARADGLKCREVGDGNLNLVFDVRNGTGGVVIKQALPYLRCAGEGWPLGRERMTFEARALAIEGELCPGLVPRLYHFDEAMSLVVMENLSKHRIMRKGLVEGVKYLRFAKALSTFLAHTLFKTSDLYLASEEKKARVEFFSRNTELCKITEDFVFTNPFMDSPDNRWNPEIDDAVRAIHRDVGLKLEIAELKDGFLSRTQALIHGDLHTGSIMLNEEDTRVIDPEFAFYGPMGFDIGALLGNLVMAACAHAVHSPDPDARRDYQSWLYDQIRGIWNGFEAEFLRLWREENRGEATRLEFFAQSGGEEALDLYRRRYLRRVLQDTAGYAGCKMMRRQMGIAHVYDIDCIDDPKRRASVERRVLAIGRRLVLERRLVSSIEDFIGIVESTPEA